MDSDNIIIIQGNYYKDLLMEKKDKERSRYVPDFIKKMPEYNLRRKIKIRFNKLKSGAYSVYLDHWKNGTHVKKHLTDIAIIGKRSTKEQDNNNFNIILKIRDKEINRLIEEKHDFNLKEPKNNMNFIEYFRTIGKTKKNKNHENVIKMLIKYHGEVILFRDITHSFCRGFGEFLLSQRKRNTANVYYAMFNAAMNRAVEDELIKSNPARKHHLKREDTMKEFLTPNELQLFFDQETVFEETKLAFVFAAYTGLRASDISKLTFDDINEDRLKIRQQKTTNVLYLPLHEVALKILEKQKLKRHKGNKVFKLHTKGYVNKQIRSIAKEAGINKYLSFHCSRHSYATALSRNGNNVDVITTMMGKRDIRSTLTYLNVENTTISQAINNLPKLNLSEL